MHGTEAPSAWVQRFGPLIAPAGAVLDVACGHGRHSRWLAARGHPVAAIDRDLAAVASVAAIGPQVRAVEADIENGAWPLPGETFAGVVVTNYLWRPLLPTLLASVAPGGLLIYETFGIDHAAIGRPSRPDFLLQPGELLRACAGWRVLAYEDGFLDGPPRFVQRIAARREDPAQPSPAEGRRL